MNSLHCMIDLETMGVSSSPAICSIGAVIFKPSTGEIVDYFYAIVSLESSVKAGLKIDASTVRWWLSQKEAARDIFMTDAPQNDLAIALHAFRKWFLNWKVAVQPEGLDIWANGAAEDCVWLMNAYRALEIEAPYDFRHQRCYRTLKNLYPSIKGEPGEVAHNALADAEWQAEHLMKILEVANVE